MALTDEQKARIEELQAEKSEYVKARSEYFSRKARLDDVLDNLDEIWESEFPTVTIPPEPQLNPRITSRSNNTASQKVIKNILFSEHGSGNYYDKLVDDLDKAYNWLEREYSSEVYANSAFYDRWREGFVEKVNKTERRNHLYEALEICRDNINAGS